MDTLHFQTENLSSLLQGIVDQEAELNVDPSILEVVDVRLAEIMRLNPNLTGEDVRNIAVRLIRIAARNPETLNDAMFLQNLREIGLQALFGTTTILDQLEAAAG